MKKVLAILLFLAAGSLPAAANPDFDLGPPVGHLLPAIGNPQDSTGAPRSLSSLAGPKGTVLFFFRAASWCPFCQAQLIDLNGGYSEIKKRGFGLAGISYEAPTKNATFATERHIQYPLLSDPGSKIIDRMGLRDPQYKEGSMAYGVPRPIIFVLDARGVIKAKLYEETYKTRPPLALVLETLDKVR